MKEDIRHIMNPLHVYCRLRDCKIPKPFAVRVCTWYENHLFCFLFSTKATAH
jgi:hypothetical protein